MAFLQSARVRVTLLQLFHLFLLTGISRSVIVLAATIVFSPLAISEPNVSTIPTVGDLEKAFVTTDCRSLAKLSPTWIYGSRGVLKWDLLLPSSLEGVRADRGWPDHKGIEKVQKLQAELDELVKTAEAQKKVPDLKKVVELQKKIVQAQQSNK